MSLWIAENLGLGLGLLAGFIHLSGIASALHAAVRTRTAQGAVAWSISLITFPYLALPLYWVFGRGKFHGYVAARRSGDLKIHHLAADLRRRLESGHQAALPPDAVHLRVFEHLVGLPFSGGNDVHLLKDGEEAFADMFAAIDAAEDYLLLQVYILRDDDLGRDLKARLVRRAGDGLPVHLLYDEIGSYGLPRAFIGELTAAGVSVCPFGTTQGPVNRFQLNFRNHRKILIADGRVAFVGGLNFGDEYLGRDAAIGPWRDTHLRLEPGRRCRQSSWCSSRTGTGPPGGPGAELGTGAVPARGQRVLPANRPGDPRDSCELFFLEALRSTRRRIWIASPVLRARRADRLAALALAAAARGRRAHPAAADRPTSCSCTCRLFHTIRNPRTGHRHLSLCEGFLHQKVLLVDDDLASVGTANLDNRSFRLNFELSIVVWDRGFAAAVAAMLEEDFASSRLVTAGELDERSFWFRFGVSLSRLLAPVL
jgi:cardiolipin synthase A/B